MEMSEKIDKIMPALLSVKRQMGAVKKDAANNFFKSKYADLNNYLEEIEPVLQSNGLVLLQPCSGRTVKSIIFHAESGQYVSSSMELIMVKEDNHALGSAQTYARRYSLAGLLAFQSTEDDDGEASVGRGKDKFLAPKSTPAPTAGVQRGFGAKSGGDSAWNN